jgi:hypothetical protein
MREKTAASPHVPRLRSFYGPNDDAGARHIALIDVKLSETAFRHLQRPSIRPQPPDRAACRQPHPFGRNPSGCFQLHNHDRGEPFESGCWWRLGANQPMRNVALAVARLWVDAGETDNCRGGLGPQGPSGRSPSGLRRPIPSRRLHPGPPVPARRATLPPYGRSPPLARTPCPVVSRRGGT